jgi:hypothetical protein
MDLKEHRVALIQAIMGQRLTDVAMKTIRTNRMSM